MEKDTFHTGNLSPKTMISKDNSKFDYKKAIEMLKREFNMDSAEEEDKEDDEELFKEDNRMEEHEDDEKPRDILIDEFDETFACDKCNNKFRQKFLLQSHILVAHSEMDYSDMNYNIFTVKKDTNCVDTKVSTSEFNFVCDQCNFSCSSEIMLKTHKFENHRRSNTSMTIINEVKAKNASEITFKIDNSSGGKFHKIITTPAIDKDYSCNHGKSIKVMECKKENLNNNTKQREDIIAKSTLEIEQGNINKEENFNNLGENDDTSKSLKEKGYIKENPNKFGGKRQNIIATKTSEIEQDNINKEENLHNLREKGQDENTSKSLKNKDYKKENPIKVKINIVEENIKKQGDCQEQIKYDYKRLRPRGKSEKIEKPNITTKNGLKKETSNNVGKRKQNATTSTTLKVDNEQYVIDRQISAYNPEERSEKLEKPSITTKNGLKKENSNNVGKRKQNITTSTTLKVDNEQYVIGKQLNTYNPEEVSNKQRKSDINGKITNKVKTQKPMTKKTTPVSTWVSIPIFMGNSVKTPVQKANENTPTRKPIPNKISNIKPLPTEEIITVPTSSDDDEKISGGNEIEDIIARYGKNITFKRVSPKNRPRNVQEIITTSSISDKNKQIIKDFIARRSLDLEVKLANSDSPKEYNISSHKRTSDNNISPSSPWNSLIKKIKYNAL